MCAPIVLFVYARVWHTKVTVEFLANNKEAKDSILIIYSDAPKNEKAVAGVNEVREYIKTIAGFKDIVVIEREHNYGLAKSIIDGVGSVLNEYGKAIIIEDDLQTSPFFLEYMNWALDTYENDLNVASIHGYIYPVKAKYKLRDTFFIKGADCWGWATWKRAWNIFEPDGKKLLELLIQKQMTKEFDFNGHYGYTKMLKGQIAGKNDSWAVRWYASAYLNDMLTLYPSKSLVKNIGQDSSGTHSGYSKFFDVTIVDKLDLKRIDVTESKEGRLAFENFFFRLKIALPIRVFNKAKHKMSLLKNKIYFNKR